MVSSVVAPNGIDSSHGAGLTEAAFSVIPVFGPIVMTVGLLTFAFSTILGWSYYGERCMEYLGGKRVIKIYRLVWIVAVYLGCVVNLQLVWDFADAMNALMAIPNLIVLLALSGVIARETKKYMNGNHIDDYSPEEE